MKDIIKKQLEKVKSVNIDFDDSTTEIFIGKLDRKDSRNLRVGDICKIELDNIIFNSTTLASNWNGGKIPKHKIYTVEINSIMSKFVKVNGVSIDDSSDGLFEFWLPIDGFKILKYEE